LLRSAAFTRTGAMLLQVHENRRVRIDQAGERVGTAYRARLAQASIPDERP
jgi:hypothetical protein